MYTEAELAETIAALQDPNPSERAAMLKALWVWPSQDERLLPYVEALLSDTGPCVFGSPMRFGEIRWLAAQVIFAEFKAWQCKESVRLEKVVAPVKSEELMKLAKRFGLDCDASLAALMTTFTELQRLGQLPTTPLELWL